MEIAPTSTMLRVRITTERTKTVLVVEGRLAGPWVDELAASWASARESVDAQSIRIDLDGVSFISSPGKSLLAAIHAGGGELVGRGCMVRQILDEIADRHSK